MYRGKLTLQNTKLSQNFSPLHSPSNLKKSPFSNKKQRLSPRATYKDKNKQNKQNKSPISAKTERSSNKLDKSQKLSKETKPSTKKIIKQYRLNISSNSQKFSDFMDENFTNIQTPKFKCLSNKIDQRFPIKGNKQNYFSFGDELQQNLKENNKNRQILGEKKSELNTQINMKKKQKSKTGQIKLEQRILNIQREMRQRKNIKQRQTFFFRKS